MGLSARGVAAMTESERAPAHSLPQGWAHLFRKEVVISVGAPASLLGKERRCWRLRRRAFTGDALEISFVARRGEHPGVPDRIGLQGVLLGEIDLFTGIGRARGNALALTRGLHAHPQ